MEGSVPERGRLGQPASATELRPARHQTSEPSQAANTCLQGVEAGCHRSGSTETEGLKDKITTREEENAVSVESYAICNRSQVDMDTLLKLLSPLMISIKICGLHFTRGRSAATGKSTSNGCKVTPSMAYATILLCLLWLDLIRNLSAFSSGISVDMDFLNRLVSIFWIVLVCANFTSCYYVSLNNGLLSFLKGWTQLVPKNSLCHGDIRRSALVLVVGSWFMVITNMTYSAWSIYQSNTFDDQYTPFNVDHDQIDILRATVLVVHLMRTCAWVFAVTAFCMISYMLQWQFNKLTEEFVRQKHQQFIFRRLECFRQTHQKMCTLVDLANGFTSPLIAAQFACNVALICIILYILILGESLEKGSTMTRCFWLMGSVGAMLVFCIGSAKVNTAVSTDCYREVSS